MAINRYRLRHLADDGNKAAARTLALLERPDRLLGLILLGNNFVNIFASTVATVLALRMGGDIWLAVSTGLLTAAVLIFSELAPKTVAANYPEPIAFVAAAVYTPMLKVMYPLVWVINMLANSLLRLISIRENQTKGESLSREELKSVLNHGGKRLPDEQRDMLLSLMDFTEATVDEVLIPRSDIYGVDLADDWADIERTIIESPHHSIAVYHDDIQQLRGVINLRDLLPVLTAGKLDKAILESAIKPGYFIPENTPLLSQLQHFREEHRAVAFVVDEYGDILGLVTLDDIVEEIVGNHSQHKDIDDEELREQPDGTYLADAAISLRQLNKQLGLKIESDANTLAGMLLERFESLPEEGTHFEIDGFQMQIVEVSNNAIRQVRLTPLVNVESKT